MKKPTPIDEEVTFDDYGLEGKSIISRTDLSGNITFVNKAFCDLSGYSKSELIGKPHSIVRHPDMPRQAFKELWGNITSDQKWHGFVKNLRKDGKYYWVESFIEPLFSDGKKIGYMSARKIVSEKDKEKYEKLYKELRKGE